MSRYDYIITNHVRERFVERFLPDSKKMYGHLRNCKGCQRCVSLIYQLKDQVRNSYSYLNKVIYARLHEAKETRIHHNNTRFMEYMHNKYGYRNFHFLVSEGVVFVVVDADDGKVVVTCIDGKNDAAIGDYVRRPKYRKKELCLA